MKEYVDLLNYVLEHGQKRVDRTGVGTIGVFGYQNRFDLSKFPIVTTKKIHFKSIVKELQWFIKGDTSINFLKNNNIRIWNEWAINDNIPYSYPHQWRNYNNNIDQFSELIHNLKTNPYSRRHILNAWNPSDISNSPLPPCHVLSQFYVDNNNKLSCHLYQRSADAFLGVPFNISSYSLLTCLIANYLKMGVGEFVHSFGDLHIYLNHIEQVNLQISREPFELPTLKILKNDLLNGDFEVDLLDYKKHESIKGDVAV